MATATKGSRKPAAPYKHIQYDPRSDTYQAILARRPRTGRGGGGPSIGKVGPTRKTADEAHQDRVAYEQGHSVMAAPRPRRRTTPRPPVPVPARIQRAQRAIRNWKRSIATGAGWLYLYTDGEYLKIGRSTYPPERFDTCQTCHAEDLFMLGEYFVNNMVEAEAGLKERFEDSLYKREWYHVTDELLDEFDA